MATDTGLTVIATIQWMFFKILLASRLFEKVNLSFYSWDMMCSYFYKKGKDGFCFINILYISWSSFHNPFYFLSTALYWR